MTGVVFSEIMRGQLNAVGNGSRCTRAVLRGKVSISNLQQFIDDPNHLGEIAGDVYVPALSPQFLTARGHVRLFAMGDVPGERVMDYRMDFFLGRSTYALIGRKCVRDDGGLDAWHDVTTLHASIVEVGPESVEKALWTGKMTLSLLQALRLLTTLRGTGAGFLAKARAVLRFGFFFLSEVAARYLPVRGKGRVARDGF